MHATYVYNPAGLLYQATDGSSGAVDTYVYDAAGRVTSETQQIPNPGGSPITMTLADQYIGGGDANLYRYCGNDPTDATDPSGLQAPGLEGALTVAQLQALHDNPPKPLTEKEEMVRRLLAARRNTWVIPMGTNTCERWANECGRQMAKQGPRNNSVHEMGITTFTFKKSRWFGGTTAHAAYRIVFRDGTVVYVDNGAFGGFFEPSDIPSDATEDYPPSLPPSNSQTSPSPTPTSK